MYIHTYSYYIYYNYTYNKYIHSLKMITHTKCLAQCLVWNIYIYTHTHIYVYTHIYIYLRLLYRQIYGKGQWGRINSWEIFCTIEPLAHER